MALDQDAIRVGLDVRPMLGRVVGGGRPAEQGALAAGGFAAVIVGLGIEPGVAAGIAFGVGLVPGLVTGLINAGGVRGFARRIWQGRDDA